MKPAINLEYDKVGNSEIVKLQSTIKERHANLSGKLVISMKLLNDKIAKYRERQETPPAPKNPVKELQK